MGIFLFAWIVGVAIASFIGGWMHFFVFGLFVLGAFCHISDVTKRFAFFFFGVAMGVGFGVSRLPFNAQYLSWNLLLSEKRWPIVREEFIQLPAWTNAGKQWMQQKMEQAFAPDEASLLAGMLYGDAQLTKQDKQVMRNVGLLHLIALSGTNVTFIFVGVGEIILFFGGSRRFAIGIAASSLFFFLVFVGFSASILRAAFMGWAWMFAPIFGRPSALLRWLLLSAVFQLLWHPNRLLFDAGFALSYLAMMGLWASSQWEEKLLASKKNLAGVIFRLFFASVVITLLTAPYLCWAFGQVTWIGFVSTAIAEPVVSLIMIFGVLFLIWPSAPWIYWPLRGFLDWILWISRWLNKTFPWAVSSARLPFLLALGLFCSIFFVMQGVVHRFSKKREDELS